MELRDDDLFITEAKKKAEIYARKEAMLKTFQSIVAFFLLAIFNCIKTNVSIITLLASHIPLAIYCFIACIILGIFIYFGSISYTTPMEHSKLVKDFKKSLIYSMLEPNKFCPIIMIKARDKTPYGNFIFHEATNPNNVLEACRKQNNFDDEMVYIYLNHHKLEEVTNDEFFDYYQFVDCERRVLYE